MITKAEQKILDNAPEGAEEYKKVDCIVGSGIVYGCCMGGSSLSDLRKKQGKTVVELFDGCKYTFCVGDIKFMGIYKSVRDAFFNVDTGNKICGSTEAVDIKLYIDPNAPTITPTVKPVYTQEMKDAGELPSVGMLVLDGKDDRCIFLGNYKGEAWLVADNSNSEFGTYCDLITKLKPIDTRTPEQKQVDEVTEVMFGIDKWHHDSRTVAEHLQKAGLLASIK